MHLRGTKGADQLHGAAQDDTISGLGGDDLITGEGGDDRLSGGDGNDLLYGGASNYWGYPVPAPPPVSAPAALVAAPAASAAPAGDTLEGGAGSDQLYGDEGDDLLDGGVDGDHLFGAGGDDRLLGGGGADYLSGGWGADTLNGGAGDDTYNGDYDGFADVFAFQAPKGAAGGGFGHDQVYGFDAAGADQIRFVGYTAADLAGPVQAFADSYWDWYDPSFSYTQTRWQFDFKDGSRVSVTLQDVVYGDGSGGVPPVVEPVAGQDYVFA